MFKVRVIPCLDVKDGRVVKGVNFVDLRDAGDPVEAAIAKLNEFDAVDDAAVLDVEGVNFVDLRDAGDPVEAAIAYDAAGAIRDRGFHGIAGVAQINEVDALDVKDGRVVNGVKFVELRDRGFHGIAGVAQINEVDALDDAAVLDVEAGDDADLEH